MYRDVAVIIPALERNRYSEDGDLVKFGDLNLLEWKLTQVKAFIDPGQVFVTTPSKKIEKIVSSYGARTLRRKEGAPMSDVIVDAAGKIDKRILVWTHVTSPFVSSADFKNTVDKYLSIGKRHDSVVSVFKLQEFIIFNDKALNFEMTKVSERKSIEPVYRITNGCFVAGRDIYLRYRNYFGIKPFLHEQSMLSSIEVKEVGDLAIANDLISLFIRRGLHV